MIRTAILAHLTRLGIVVEDDGGALFVFAGSLFTLAVHRVGLLEWRARLTGRKATS